ncbi:hypothetical protein B9479_001483 [Cryptococcus floricola]|uniref:Uncharacterized protein n=1 Tax=Cryptococcus floricola TaxID=2591691 RepID=A0A5D3B6S0_9TREE|nr:hypothetical protein B9479_001483 [Cryptococcus floricola]
MSGKSNKGVRTDGPILSYTVIHLPTPLTHSQSRLKFSSNDDPTQTNVSLSVSSQGRADWNPLAESLVQPPPRPPPAPPHPAASQPSSSNLPADATPKRAAASSLNTTAKKSRVDEDDTKIQKPPASEGAQRPIIASARIDMTNDEIVSDSDSDSDISSDEDDDDIQEDDEISANNLNDGYAKCVEAGEMDQSSLPAQKDEFCT